MSTGCVQAVTTCKVKQHLKDKITNFLNVCAIKNQYKLA